MDIAAMSTIMSQTKVRNQANISIMKMAMDVGETRMNEMTKMIEQSAQPHLGKNIDVQV